MTDDSCFLVEMDVRRNTEGVKTLKATVADLLSRIEILEAAVNACHEEKEGGVRHGSAQLITPPEIR